jgi:hypothetical protein
MRGVGVRTPTDDAGDSAVIEEALRRELRLDLLERALARNHLSEDEAMALADEAQHASRRRR